MLLRSLSFSCLLVGEKPQLIHVVSSDKEGVSYRAITQDFNLSNLNSCSAFELFKDNSFDDVYSKLSQQEAPLQKAAYSDLSFAFQPKEQHLCAGLNYLDHVQESGQKNEMLLFPKFGKVTSYGSKIQRNRNSKLPELLDFEVEMGLTFDRDIHKIDDLIDARAGFFVANDFSDRAPQIFYFGAVEGHDSYSFAAAKSKSGYSLVSPILTIPENWRDFSKNLELKLFVNDTLKQSSNTSKMSLSLEEMLDMALKTSKTKKWPVKLKEDTLTLENPISLLPLDDADRMFLPEGTVFMTGTPGGTLFQKPKAFDFFQAALNLIFTQSPSGLSLKEKFKVSLIQNWARSGKFLKKGDVIESEITGLGRLDFFVE